MKSQAQARQLAGLPTLPVEVLSRVVFNLSAAASEGEPSALRTLARLSVVSHLVREWALQALYTILVLPRHVRDFRKWYERMRTSFPPFPCARHVKGLFIGIDDITRLTTASAGWESEMLRLLHYCGSSIEYLSLWQTESRALLRDAAQVRRHGTSQPTWAIGEQMMLDDEPEEPMYDPVDPNDIPRWLRSELEHEPTEQVAKAHAAHFPFAPRSNTTDIWRERPKPRACTPRFLSMVLSYPFYENERPELFCNMTIWSRVEELDIYMASDVAKSLSLLSKLGHTPIKRLRVSSSHASLAIETNGTHPNQYTNACHALHTLIQSRDLAQAFVHEFAGRFVHEPIVLEAACLRLLEEQSLASLPPNGIHLIDEQVARRERLAMRLTLTQGSQSVWGKLKHRQWDFRERAQFHRPGAWSLLLR